MATYYETISDDNIHCAIIFAAGYLKLKDRWCKCGIWICTWEWALHITYYDIIISDIINHEVILIEGYFKNIKCTILQCVFLWNFMKAIK